MMSRKPPDFGLWLETAKTVLPLRRNGAHERKATSIPSATRKTVPAPAPTVPIPAHRHQPPPEISGLDRRTTQRLTRGQVEIDGRLDLHGTGVEMARVRLLAFLRAAQSTGLRTVLVITGKGDSPFSRHTLHGAGHFHAPERAGRLRRLVTEWFHEPEFRQVVAGFQPAHPKHGGGGAYYVRVRRIRAKT